MPQVEDASTGQKRGPGRPPKVATPVAKRPRLSTDVRPSPSAQSPATATPLSEKQASRLPSKISDAKPLPTLPTPPSSNLTDSEYQTIAASAVLQASFTRSQARWTQEGLFERYWFKPETGKTARPPPPNNPEAKWMKRKGECRIRIEPHIFECEMYVEEKPKPPAPPKQYAPGVTHTQYAQPYRPPQQQPYAPAQQAYQQGRPLPPNNQQIKVLPPMNASRAPTPSRAQQPSPQQAPQQGRGNPDPVISKLAARASSDPELKGLMKEVATGNASQEQLKVFQRHIDELQRQIKQEKETEEQRVRDAEAAARAREDAIQYDGVAESRHASPMPAPLHSAPQQTQPSPVQPYPVPQQFTPAPTAYQPSPPPPSKPYVQPPPARRPVILSFNTPGATEDRFLFPQNAILESLSEHHLLASFLITRRGWQAKDPTGLDPEKTYWQPVTLMLEVKYRLEDLPEYVKKWVNPPDEVRKYMEDIMSRCERAPETHLALRLPLKGSATGAETDDSGVSKEVTPVSTVDEKSRSRPNVKYIKKATAPKGAPTSTPLPSARKGSDAKRKSSVDQKSGNPASISATVVANKEQKDTTGASTAKRPSVDGGADIEEKTESGRPKRAVRKSVRISEG